MNYFRKSALISLLALSQLLLVTFTSASDDEVDYSNEAQFSEAQLAQILAPIALYPDSLLSHIVIASTYPLEVVEAYRWQQQNSELGSATAVELAEKQGWDPSVTALVAFPSVLERLNEDLQWTQNLGNAFLEDEEQVLAVIQDLRQQAQKAKSLEALENMKVTQVNQQILIEPIRQEIVYVPYYDTRVVYGNWHYHRYPPVYWDHRPYFSVGYSSGRHSGHQSGHFYWNAGVNINFNYFFSAFRWHSRHIIVTNHRHTRRYRPHHRIATSYGASQWKHQPIHRRGVAYRSHRLNQHYTHSRTKVSVSAQTQKNRTYEREYGENYHQQHRQRHDQKQRLGDGALHSQTRNDHQARLHKKLKHREQKPRQAKIDDKPKRYNEQPSNKHPNTRIKKPRFNLERPQVEKRHRVEKYRGDAHQYKQAPRQQRVRPEKRNRPSVQKKKRTQ